MKIALVAHEIHDHGGMERCMANLARWLKAHGETVHLYTADDHCPLADEGFHWTQIPTVKRPLALRLWLFHQRARHLLSAENYDIIHANGGIVPNSNVVTVHFCQPAWRHVLSEPVVKQMYGGKNVWRLWNRKMALVLATDWEKKAVQHARQVFCVSRQVAKEVVQYYQPKQEPLVVYNGVSLTEFAPPADEALHDEMRTGLGAEPTDMVLLFVGEFGRKGLQYALEALAEVPLPYVKLWIAGRDPLESVFKAQAESLGLNDRVQFLGFRKDVSALMQAADVLVLPATYEPFGLVVTEAMASGLPVITTARVGAGELIDSGTNGFILAEASNTHQLAQLVQRLANDPGLRRTVGQAARKTAEQYSWDQMSVRMYKAYEELLSLSSGKTAAYAQ